MAVWLRVTVWSPFDHVAVREIVGVIVTTSDVRFMASLKLMTIAELFATFVAPLAGTVGLRMNGLFFSVTKIHGFTTFGSDGFGTSGLPPTSDPVTVARYTVFSRNGWTWFIVRTVSPFVQEGVSGGTNAPGGLTAVNVTVTDAVFIGFENVIVIGRPIGTLNSTFAGSVLTIYGGDGGML
jgi:hypothetical protein